MMAHAQSLDQVLLRPEEARGLPVDFAAVFGRRAPLALEIGFGAGESLVWWSERHPDWNFVGVEVAQEGIVRAAKLLAGAGRDHVRLLCGDVRTLLCECFAPASLHRVLMQFPMPWPKERHAKHRVSNPAFVRALAHALEPGGVFELVTDQEGYAQNCHAVLVSQASFRVAAVETNPSREFPTRYEKKWLADGRSVFRVRATLQSSVSLNRLCSSDPMLHHHLKRIPADEEISSLAGRSFRSPGMAVEIKECFRGPQSWMLRAVAADESFTQFVWLRLSLRQDSVVLKVGDQPRPYATPAVRFLLEQVAATLATEPSSEN